MSTNETGREWVEEIYRHWRRHSANFLSTPEWFELAEHERRQWRAVADMFECIRAERDGEQDYRVRECAAWEEKYNDVCDRMEMLNVAYEQEVARGRKVTALRASLLEACTVAEAWLREPIVSISRIELRRLEAAEEEVSRLTAELELERQKRRVLADAIRNLDVLGHNLARDGDERPAPTAMPGPGERVSK